MDNLECMHSIQRCCVFRIVFIVLSHSLRRWPRCCCFIAEGHGGASEPRYHRYCGICISFPQSPAGQPSAVYLPGYKAASQWAKGKGFDTEVGVAGTGCHCVLQQRCETWKQFRRSWRGAPGVKGCLLSSVTARTDWKHVVPLLHTNH